MVLATAGEHFVKVDQNLVVAIGRTTLSVAGISRYPTVSICAKIQVFARVIVNVHSCKCKCALS